MRVAVLGAGVAGLTAAHRLSLRGHRCDVLERWPGLGGQAATIDAGQGHVLERYYHHLFTSDTHIAALYAELGLPGEIEFLESTLGFFVDGRAWPFTTPTDLLRFGPVPLVDRVRMGLAVLRIQRGSKGVEHYENETASNWVCRNMGEPAWDKVWGPLLRGKFAGRADEISMAWLWSKLTVRRQVAGEEARKELLGYPRHSFELLFGELVRRIEDGGGRVLVDRPARAIRRDGDAFEVEHGAPGSFRTGHDPRAFETAGRERYDAVVSTVPSDVFLGLLDEGLQAALGAEYLARVRQGEYQTALVLLAEIDRRLSPYYWLNIADRDMPFLAVIEHTNYVDPARYDGRRFVYVSNYLDRDHPWLSLSMEELIVLYEPGLRRINPGFDTSWIKQSWVFKEPAAQPVVTVGFQHRIPPLRTPVDGLVLANTLQIYPEDRGTNYSVRLGEQAAEVLLGGPLPT